MVIQVFTSFTARKLIHKRIIDENLREKVKKGGSIIIAREQVRAGRRQRVNILAALSSYHAQRFKCITITRQVAGREC